MRTALALPSACWASKSSGVSKQHHLLGGAMSVPICLARVHIQDSSLMTPASATGGNDATDNILTFQWARGLMRRVFCSDGTAYENIGSTSESLGVADCHRTSTSTTVRITILGGVGNKTIVNGGGGEGVRT